MSLAASVIGSHGPLLAGSGVPAGAGDIPFSGSAGEYYVVIASGSSSGAPGSVYYGPLTDDAGNSLGRIAVPGPSLGSIASTGCWAGRLTHNTAGGNKLHTWWMPGVYELTVYRLTGSPSGDYELHQSAGAFTGGGFGSPTVWQHVTSIASTLLRTYEETVAIGAAAVDSYGSEYHPVNPVPGPGDEVVGGTPAALTLTGDFTGVDHTQLYSVNYASSYFYHGYYLETQQFHRNALAATGVGGTPYQAAGTITPAGWSAAVIVFTFRAKPGSSTAGGANVSHDQSPITGQQLLAFAAGSLIAYRYNDVEPPAIQGSVTVETTGVTGCSLACRSTGETDLFYCQADALKYRVSRDQAVTFMAAVTLATGYRHVTHWFDEDLNLWAVFAWRISDGKWYVFPGELGSDGRTLTFGSPVLVVTGDDAGASLRRFGENRWSFAYAVSGIPQVVRTSLLKPDGTGSAWV